MGWSDEFYAVRDEVRNWGRWGDDDRLGTLNLVTDEVVAAAAATVRSGRRVSCAIELRHDGVQLGQIPGRINPLHTMVSIDHPDLGDPDGTAQCPHFSDDVVTMALQAGTHWDGLAHVSYGHELYNGVPASTITARGGATVLGIENVRHLVGRGVLLDVAGALGVERLEPDHEITGDDLDAAAEFGGVEVRSGDIVLVRTGRIQLWREMGAEAYVIGPDRDGRSPGPGFDAVRWFHRHEVAAVANDTYIFEVFPGPRWEDALGVHCLHVVDMGLTQGQNWDLEELAAVCADEGRHDFLLCANPEPVVGATGSPVNPVAVF
ncbi:MAG: cyclase family protein [Actinomyces sp.]|nr:MAG: cyclase family protein [Actinomyces sp.]